MNRFAALRLSLPGHSMGNSAGAIGPSLSLRSGSSLSQRSGGVSPFTPGVIPGGPLSSPLSARSRAPELRVDDTPAALAAVEKARFAFLSDVLAAEKDGKESPSDVDDLFADAEPPWNHSSPTATMKVRSR